jgi:hypothetical protein
VTGYVLLPELFRATEVDRRSVLYCYQPAGRPELSALTYDPERLADLP